MAQWFHAKASNQTINLNHVSVIEWDCKDTESGKSCTRLLIIQSTIVERIVKVGEENQIDISDRISTIELKDTADRLSLRRVLAQENLTIDREWKPS